MQEVVKDNFFDCLYSNYETKENLEFYEISSNEIVELTKEFCSREVENVLDLCCGTGILTNILRKNFRESRITGVDISEKMISIAKKKNIKDVGFLLYDGNEIENINQKFDVIVSNYGLQWLKEKSIKQISSILNNGGMLVCSLPGYTTGKVEVTRESTNYVGNNFFKLIVEKSKKYEKLDNTNYAKRVIKVWSNMLEYKRINEIANSNGLKCVFENVKSATLEYSSPTSLVKSVINRGTFGDVFINGSKNFICEIVDSVEKYKNKYKNLKEESITQYIVFIKGEDINE